MLVTPNIDRLNQTRQELLDKLNELDQQAGDRSLSRPEMGKWNRLVNEICGIDRQIAEAQAQLDRQDEIAESRAKWGSLQVGGTTTDPWQGLDVRRESRDGIRSRATRVLDQSEDLSDQARESLDEAVRGHNGDIAAAIVTARANPAYRTAFEKVLVNPERGLFTLDPAEMSAMQQVEQVRAAMSTSTASAGYLLPLSLDPNAVLTNSGAANPARMLATIKQAVSSPHRAVSSAGVNAEWLDEAAVFADASPTFAGLDIPLFKLGAYVFASYEVLEDSAADIASILPGLLADARDRAESAAFATGNGTTAPKGVVTALVAGSALVTCTTRGSFTSASSGDILSLLNAQTPRTRQSDKTAWVMNNSILSVVRQQVIGTAGSLLMDLSDDGRLLGHGVYEASSMTSATTSGSHIAVLADFSKYQIVDHIQGGSLEFLPNITDATTGRPSGQRGWVWHHRVGADLLDVSAGKVLLA